LAQGFFAQGIVTGSCIRSSRLLLHELILKVLDTMVCSQVGKDARVNQKRGHKNAVAINVQIVEAAQRQDLHSLLRTIDKHLFRMNIVNLSTAVHRVAKLASVSPDMPQDLPLIGQLFEAIAKALQQANVKQLKPQSVSNIIWALASMQVVHMPVVELCMQFFEKNLSSFKPFEFTTTLWALAKLRTFEPRRFPSMKSMLDAGAEHLMKRAQQFQFRCLSMIAWSYATSQEFNAQLFDLLGAQLTRKPSDGCGQELSLTAWAFGTAGICHRALFDTLTVRAIEQVDTFKPQELSNLIWGCASSGFFHQELFSTILAGAKKKKLESQHLANILWAFSRANPDSRDSTFVRKAHFDLLPQCIQQFDSFKPEEVASVALSTAKAFGRDALRDRLKRGHQAPSKKDISLCPPPLVVAFFKLVNRWIVAKKDVVPMRVLVTVIETYSRTCRLSLDEEDSHFFVFVAQELLLRLPSCTSELLIRIFQLFSVGEPASVPGMPAIMKPLATSLSQKSRSFSKSNLKDLSNTFTPDMGWDCKSNFELLSHLDAEACKTSAPVGLASRTHCEVPKEGNESNSETLSEVGSTQPTDEPSSDSEDQGSSASWDSGNGTSDHLNWLPPQADGKTIFLCTVKNTFIDVVEQDEEQNCHRRSCSAPAHYGRVRCMDN